MLENLLHNRKTGEIRLIQNKPSRWRGLVAKAEKIDSVGIWECWREPADA